MSQAKMRRRPFGSGIGSPNSVAVSIQRRIASCALARDASGVGPWAAHPGRPVNRHGLRDSRPATGWEVNRYHNVGQVGNLRRVVNPPADTILDRQGRPINNRPQDAILP